MHSDFEALRETLLREGVAPRHVRRYLIELREHLADLTARERALGHDAGDAAIRARAALGDDQTLSRAMLERPGSRSLSARAPWAVFGVLPVLVVLASAFLAMMSPIAVAKIHGYFITPRAFLPAPDWFHALAYLVTGFTNYGLGLLIAIPFIIIALRQRMTLAWPVAGIGLIAIFASLVTATVYFPAIPAHPKTYVLFATQVSFPPDSHHPFLFSIFLFRMLLILLPATAIYLALCQRLTASAPSA